LRAGEIILRLRELARGSPSRRAPCDLNDVVRDLMPLINADARHHNVRIALDLAHERLLAEQDPEQIQQILLNLLHNAIDALAEEPAQTREIRISTSRGNGGQVQLDVCDNGRGVDPRIAAQMFHPFCTTKPAGTGLGLAISHSIARAHGGHLEYIPGSARGARFRLSLPRSSGEP
jgi:C4-dicarboxylate-specific signal transduction histidine kinase